MTDEADIAGVLAVGAYHRAMWEATRALIADYQQITGDTMSFQVPAWHDLPPEVQSAVVALGKEHLDKWDRIVIETAGHEDGNHVL